VYTFYLFIVIYLLLQCIHQDFSSGEASPEESVLGISTQSSPPTFQQEVMLKQSFMHNNMRGSSTSSPPIFSSNDNSNPNTAVPQQQQQQQHTNEEQALTWCHHMRHRHKVKPGISWGPLSPIDQVRERDLACYLSSQFITVFQCLFFSYFTFSHTHTHFSFSF
jgi:hypothetical protein